LISAAYLSAAGLRVLVVEGQTQPGGDTMTEELTLPGFHHDSCSTAHTLIQSNPLIRDDELRLHTYGLRYLRPDPVVVMPFADGESMSLYQDIDRTVAEIKRFSPADAEAYLQLLSDWEALKPLQAAERNAPPLTPEAADGLWRSGPLGDEGLRIRMASGLQIIQERFRNPYVQGFVAWLATLTLEPIDHPYTGILPFSLTAGRQTSGWAIPEGGSGSLPRALIEIIRRRGGDIVCGRWVKRIMLDGGRAVGVETESETFYAEKAVVSSAHITQLPEALGDAIDDESRRYISHWRAGLTMFVSHYALSEAPRYRTHDGDCEAVAMGVIESVENLQLMLGDFYSGRLHMDKPFFLCLNPTVVDQGRAPQGQHTLKVISKQPYGLIEGPEHWDEIKQDVSSALLETFLSYTTNLKPEHILGSHVESPLDLERRNPNNFRGSCHGGAAMPSQSGWFRPAPGWNQYRTPVDGFYLTGSCTHPGGSVSGFPGRNAARVVLEDLDISWDRSLEGASAMAEGNAGPAAQTVG
jgi:phytoene dehydrogenase-like protein